jgi:hypothetical protein
MTNNPRRTQKLPPEESLALLSGVTMGRIVFTHNALPAIRPVNHIVDDEAIVVRSHMGAAIVSHAEDPRGAVVAYEADELDPVRHVGWSVIVTGTARIVREPAAIARYQALLRPWVEGDMDYIVSIHAEIITGIRLVDAGHHRADGAAPAVLASRNSGPPPV